MSFRSFHKKTFFLAICISGMARLSAQQYEFRFLPIKELAIDQQSFIGKLGDRIFLSNHQNMQSLDLVVYDLNTESMKTRNYPFPRQKMAVFVMDSSLLFVSSAIDKGILSAHFLELDQQGEILQEKEMPLPMLKQPVHLIASADKKNLLFYQLSKAAGDSSFITGTIFGANAENKKQLYYSFRYSSELDMEPVVFLDDHANTHVLVTDKHSNYRISGGLTLNTVPFDEDQIVSETFNFNQVKLKNLQVFQNNECQCLQVEGMYVGGLDKNNKGIYSIAFPPGRKNELAPRFIPFQPEMIRQFKSGFSATDETIRKNIEIQDILYSDSGSYVVARLSAGAPQKVASLNSGGVDPAAKAIAQSVAIGRANDIQTPVTTTSSTTTNNTQQRGRVRRTGTDVPAESSSPMVSGNGDHYQSPLSSRASGRNAPKLLFMKLDKEQGISWYTARSLDIFNIEIFNRQLLAGPNPDALALVVYQPDAQEDPYPVFIGIQDGKQVLEKIPVKKMLFSPITAFPDHRFGALYLNTDTFEGGIMLAQRKPL